MGALYLAAVGDRGLERLLAIKTVLPHLADAEYIARFRDEAKIVVKLSHGNLIPVFDAGQADGELFLAMDFVQGKDLRAMWNRCAKKAVAFPIDIAVYILKELCRGLHYAHSFGDIELVHRDISPPNVLVSYSGEVKLTDFGLASSTLKLEKTAPGIIYGKVAYMSPEQARGEKLDGRSDLYAAAIILWELLTGRQLFPPGEEQPQDLLDRARDPKVLSPSRRAPRVPVELDAILVKALSARREDRYATGEEFRVALAGWLTREAPGTDAATLESFMHKLFDEDIETECVERERMMQSVRKRAMTLPPTDELRRMVEDSTSVSQPGVRADGSLGRRAADQGTEGDDRRGRGERREGQSRRGADFRAVDVPAPGAGGSTVLTPPPGVQGALAAATVSSPARAHLASPTAVIGDVLNGRYAIKELIGEGGMGRVYLAEHVGIGRKVAVKILHPVYGRMPELVERFRREARAASKIGHPHIVDVTDSGTTDDGSAYFVMEYLQGFELAHVIDREGALDVKRSLRIVTQICRALAAAHAANIIHRDLKPENVFLTLRDGTSDFIKILDFGIAKSTEAEQARDKKLTSPGMAMGTPEYMAPEQAAGRPADVRSDVYSLGAILYEMLTGVPPYEGDNFMEILTKKATVDPTPPRTLRPELPEAVDALVCRAMSRNPDQRPASMETFEYEITKCFAGRGAAVAQLLGMNTNRELVASLNPGITLRAEPTPVERERTPRPGTAEPLASVVAPTMTGDSAAEYTDAIAVKGRSGLGTFAWGVMLTMLLGGMAVLFYVISSERAGGTRGAAAANPVAAMTPTSAATIDAGALLSNALTVRSGDAGVSRVKPTAKSVKSSPKTRKSGSRRVKEPKPSFAVRTGTGPPASRREARALLKKARAYRGALRWKDARLIYERVIRGKYYRAKGHLGLAEVAFQLNDTSGVIRHGQRAVRAGAGAAARMILGHAYFKSGRYGDALQLYEKVLAANPGHREAQSAAKAARRKLGQ